MLPLICAILKIETSNIEPQPQVDKILTEKD